MKMITTPSFGTAHRFLLSMYVASEDKHTSIEKRDHMCFADEEASHTVFCC